VPPFRTIDIRCFIIHWKSLFSRSSWIRHRRTCNQLSSPPVTRTRSNPYLAFGSSGIIIGNLNPFQNNHFRKGWIIFLILLFTFLGFYIAPIYQNLCDKKQWQGFQLVTTSQSIYGNIVVTKIKEQFSFFQNGVLLFTVPDKLTAEESVHYALLEHPHPTSVLLIGGGAGGSIEEAQKHPSLQTVDYVELDPLLVNLAFDFTDSANTDSEGSGLFHIHHTDGRLFIKSTDKKYDVVILNLPNPYSAQLNRFYTIEFYREIKQILRPGGIVSVQMPSSENAIGPELSAYLSTIHATLGAVFIWLRDFRNVS